jgi:hypothetical protein
MFENFHVDYFPQCNCNHDFYDGMNFHFEYKCPKYEPVHIAEQFFYGWHMTLGGMGIRRISLSDLKNGKRI